MIPRIFHRSIPTEISVEFRQYWRTLLDLHPGWEFRTYRDPLNPDEWELGHLFERCTAGAQLAGLVRVEAVWKWGGWYVDMDVEPLRSFEPLAGNQLAIGSEDGTLYTDAIFGAEAGHPALRQIMDTFLEGYWDPSPHETGPTLMTKVLAGRDDVTILPAITFYPYLYWEKQRRFEDFTHDERTVAVHHWNHSWKDWNK
jgi:inositol phosphorylceramide mannosyltransferase catalytic subunit